MAKKSSYASMSVDALFKMRDEIAEVLRDLFLLKADKELSFGERKMLDNARGLLLKELSLATTKDELFSEEEVRLIFGVNA